MQIKLIIFLCVLGACQVSPDSQKHFRLLTQEQMQSDFDALQKSLKAQHPGLYRYLSKDSLEKYFKDVSKKLNRSMNVLEFYQLIAPLIAKIQCGHTSIRLNLAYFEDTFQKKNLFPLKIKWIDNRAFVFKNFSQDEDIEIGMELLTIRQQSMQNIIQDILPVLSADAGIMAAKYYQIEENFEDLYALLFEPEASNFEIVLRNQQNQQIIHKNVKAISKKDHRQWAEKISLLQFDVLDFPQTAILTIKTFDNQTLKSAGLDFKSFINNALETILKNNISDILIDIRGNNGGNIDLMYYLLQSLQKNIPKNYSGLGRIEVSSHYKGYGEHLTFINPQGKRILPINFSFEKVETPTYNGKVYVLINGGTCSAASVFAAILHQYQRAIFIGEETGGAYSGYSAGIISSLELPHSQLYVKIPLWSVYQDTPFKLKNKGVIPDYPIKSNWSDMVKQIDTAKKFGFGLIQK